MKGTEMLNLITGIEAKCYDTIEADGTYTSYRRQNGEMKIWAKGGSIAEQKIRYARRAR